MIRPSRLVVLGPQKKWSGLEPGLDYACILNQANTCIWLVVQLMLIVVVAVG